MTVAAPAPMPPLVELSGICKEYETGGTVVRAMREVDLAIAQGEFVAIVGASGSGKSTMMNILGCLDRPSRGTYRLAGIEVGGRPGDSRAIVRNRLIGFIFQGFNLLPRTTALENVELPLQYRGVAARERRKRARAALRAVGLGERMDHTPNQLSGGQQQRVAIARALVTDPPLLLADEPTGNLDTRTSLEVLALLQRLNRERRITIVLVTHEHDIASCASRVVTMRDGRVVSDVVQDAPLDAAAELARLPVEERPTAAAADTASGRGGAAARRVSAAVFAWMISGHVAAFAAGAAYAALALHAPGNRAFWAGAVLGELGMAAAGVGGVRRRGGRAPTFEQRVRMAFGYTMGASCPAFAAALLAFTYTPRRTAVAHVLESVVAPATRLASAPGMLAAVLFAVLIALILLRYLLLSALSGARR